MTQKKRTRLSVVLLQSSPPDARERLSLAYFHILQAAASAEGKDDVERVGHPDDDTASRGADASIRNQEMHSFP